MPTGWTRNPYGHWPSSAAACTPRGVALLFGLRPGSTALAGLAVLEVTELDPAAGVALLTGVVDGPVDGPLAERIVAATGGNPLALTDLGRELTAEQLRGGSPLPEPLPIGSHLEAHYLSRIRAYPPATRTWLLLAATDQAGDTTRLAIAARELGAGPDDAAPAEANGLVLPAPQSVSGTRWFVPRSTTGPNRRSASTPIGPPPAPVRRCRRSPCWTASTSGCSTPTARDRCC